MIRRLEEETWRLVTQPDHARLAGEFAAAWGAAGFPPPEPRAEILRAVAEHDDGWDEWEAAPAVNAAGAPRAFTEMTIPDHAAIWERGVDRLFAASPYAALLVTMHADALFTPPLDPERDSPAARHCVRLFRARLARRQKALRHRLAADPERRAWLGPEVVRPGLQLLQLCDYLSILLCSAPGKALELPYPALLPEGRSAFRYTRPAENTATLEPFPFAERPLVRRVRARRLPARPYATDEELRAALTEAEEVRLAVRLDPE